MDVTDLFRRLKRQVEVHSSVRRLFVLLVGLVVVLWLFGYNHLPYAHQRRTAASPIERCLEKKLSQFEDEVGNMDTNIVHIPALDVDVGNNQKSYLPYVGNGHIGVAINREAAISIKSHGGRILNLPIPFRPVVQISVMDEDEKRESVVSQYFKGSVHHFTCLERDKGNAMEISSSFFAHRTHPTVLEQNITISNPSGRSALVQFDQLGWTGDAPFKPEQKKMTLSDGEVPYVIGTGIVSLDKTQMLVAIAYKKVPNAVQISASDTVTLRIVTVVNYVFLANKKDIETKRATLIEKSETELRETLQQSGSSFFQAHESAWKDLWNTGFYISPSRAEDALNGDKINATMYYVLSQVRAPLHEVGVSSSQVKEANSVLSYSEGCYGGHHTLQAPSLWSSLSSEEEMLRVCNLWILTLEKLGCHHLLRAGASGVMQGMVLSFGALKFRNFHLEFNTEPKDLHRDYHFRRIWYGNSTHVNISVVVGENNKASLFAALDRKDKDYFACDAGCVDPPVELGPQKQQFPVKITDPVTSILYITSDRQHAEELHLSIHVKEIIEAPAHEHHVISMHKHGSGYSAMSTVFWVSLSLVIVGFHLYLFHLVYSEFFGASSQDRYRSRKISDF